MPLFKDVTQFLIDVIVITAVVAVCVVIIGGVTIWLFP
jgi:hypothetical protein